MNAGIVILTNNKDPLKNGSYGKFNHAALVLSDTKIIESTESSNGVVINLLTDLINHPETGEYIYLVPKDLKIGESAAREAYNLSGTPYKFWSSLFPRISGRKIKDGLNCINLVNESYKRALGYNPLWRFPDDVLKSDLFNSSHIYNNVL